MAFIASRIICCSCGSFVLMVFLPLFERIRRAGVLSHCFPHRPQSRSVPGKRLSEAGYPNAFARPANGKSGPCHLEMELTCASDGKCPILQAGCGPPSGAEGAR